jgi:hypothetical protein
MTKEPPFRQEVEARVVLTFDADTYLTTGELIDAIRDELHRLVTPDLQGRPVELVGLRVEGVREEAEIYGNEN